MFRLAASRPTHIQREYAQTLVQLDERAVPSSLASTHPPEQEGHQAHGRRLLAAPVTQHCPGGLAGRRAVGGAGRLQNTTKAIREYVFYDSAEERDFGRALEFNQGLVLYAKLPHGFNVPTPLGNHNPNCAVLLQKDGVKRLYFVV